MKNRNYARFLTNYARNPGPDLVKMFSLSGGCRRRVLSTSSRERCLISQTGNDFHRKTG